MYETQEQQLFPPLHIAEQRMLLKLLSSEMILKKEKNQDGKAVDSIRIFALGPEEKVSYNG